jgi:hypothetical protein
LHFDHLVHLPINRSSILEKLKDRETCEMSSGLNTKKRLTSR